MSEDNKPEMLSLELAKEEFQMKNAEGVVTNFTMVELTGKQRDSYLDTNNDKMKYVGGKSVGLKTFEGLQASLLTLCMRDANGSIIIESEIQKWPASVQTSLFEKAQKLCGLEAEPTEGSLKND